MSVKTVSRQSNLKFRPEKPGIIPISLIFACSILKCLFILIRLPVSHIVVYQECATFVTEGPNSLYVPCAYHSLNLVVLDCSKSSTEALLFLAYLLNYTQYFLLSHHVGQL